MKVQEKNKTKEWMEFAGKGDSLLVKREITRQALLSCNLNQGMGKVRAVSHLGEEWSRKEAHSCKASNARAWLACSRTGKVARV